MKDKFQKALTLFLLFVSSLAYGQQVISFDKDQIVNEATNQLTILAAEAGELNNFCKENSVKGEFVVDITLQGKGKVLTVFMVSSSVEDVSYQNLLKSKLTQIQFENIKIPKNERVKFRQALTFN